jgi:hypothetical protein
MLTSKQKIIKYLTYKGISQDKFSRTCGVSSGFLRGGKSFSIDYLKIFREKYPDLNMNWLIYDEGNMLLEGDSMVADSEVEYYKPDKNCETLKMLLQAKDETIAILKHQLGIDINKEDNSKAS